MYINGSLVASSTTDPSARGNLPSTGSFCFGSNDSGPGTLNACMGEWGIAAVAATTQQVADMDAYLAGRW
jgi:hypothetical protein